MSEALKLAALQSQQKSTAVGVLLTLFFGGFGMFYVSMKAGIICSILEIILWILVFVFIGAILLPIFHIIVIVLAITSINQYNQNIIIKAMAAEGGQNSLLK